MPYTSRADRDVESAGLIKEKAAAAVEMDAQDSAMSSSLTLALTLLSAGLGNATSAICTNFADIIKVRQQLHQQRSRVSFWTVGLNMVRTEGLRSFANGITATCLREGTYSTIRMGTYESFRDFYSPIVPTSSFGNKLVSGMTSGAIGAAVSTPTDLMKVRMQAARPTGKPPYRNTFIGFYEVYKEGSLKLQGGGISGGFQSLWRGTAPNVVRAAILTASQLGVYDQAKGEFKSRFEMQEGLSLHFASSFVAGFACSACSQPVDVIKVRIMSDKSRALTGSFHSLANLLQNEGPMALYKGFAACWLRLGLHSVISLILFERFRAVFGVKPL